MGRHRRAETGFRILFVCTGNICRSPVAEILTRHLLKGRLGGRAASVFVISSAGVQAVVGAPVHPDMRKELKPWGLEREGGRFTARQLVPDLVESADLILGATPKHRSAVVREVPGALPFAFGLREFARLVAVVDPAVLPTHPVARAHALIEGARAHRGMSPPVAPEDDVVPDPIGLSQAAYHGATELITQAITTIVDAVTPRPR